MPPPETLTNPAAETVRDRTLADLIDGRPDTATDRGDLILAFEKASRAVAALHARGLIHPGLMPSSFRVDDAGGLETTGATVPVPGGEADVRPDPALTDAVLRATAYVAPELARIELARVDARTDVFALGSILCQILTGSPAFRGQSDEMRMSSARGDLTDAYTRLDACGDDPAVVALAKECLEAEPEGRPRDAGELVKRLGETFVVAFYRARAAEATRAAEAARAEAERQAASAPRFSRKTVVASVLAGLLLTSVAAAGSAWFVRWRQKQLFAVELAVNEATMIRARALTANESDPAVQKAAKAALTRAAEGLKGIPFASTVRARVEQMTRAVEQEAIAAEVDRLLIDRLNMAEGNSEGLALADAAFAAAFAGAGLDFGKLEPAAIGRQLAMRPSAVSLEAASALDYWALIPRTDAVKGDTSDRKQRLAAARAADPDPFRNMIRDAIENEDRLFCRQLWQREDFQTQGADTLALYARALFNLGENALAVDVLQIAANRNPSDYKLNAALAEYLLRPLRAQGAKTSAGGTGGNALPPGAAADFARRAEPYIRSALAARPSSMPARHHLSYVLATQGRADEAIAVLSAGLRFRDDERALHDRGQLLLARGRPAEALADFKKAAELEPGMSRDQSGIGLAKLSLGDVEGAAASFREAVRLDPANISAHANLGAALLMQGRLEESVASYREAIRHDPKFVVAHLNLAIVLEAQERFEEAAAEVAEAVSLWPEAALPRKVQGDFLAHQGKYDEALAAYDQARRRAPELANLASAKAVAERNKSLAPRLTGLLRGVDKPKDAAEQLELARLCLTRSYNAAAAREFAGALAADPKKAEDLGAAYRYDAARAAARASCGIGLDDPKPPEGDRAKLRAQALGWLQADLSLRSSQYHSGPSGREQSRRALMIWKADPALAGLRDTAALAKLPETERRGWQKLWDEVNTLVSGPSSG